MGVLLELFLFLGIFFPLYHVFNVIIGITKNKNNSLDNDMPISVIIPCYNEALIVKTTIEGLLRVKHNKYECIFVNDGSADETFKKLKKRLKLEKINYKRKHNLKTKKIIGIYRSKRHPKILVINKENGGKSDALNAGINYSKNPYIVTLDADSILDKKALSLVGGAFKDPKVIAVSGVIQILQSFNLYKNNIKTTLKINRLLRLQTLEYIKSCFCYKASLAKLNSLIVISGAFGAFKKNMLLEIGGFKPVIGEDLDLTVRIQFKIEGTNKKILYLPNAICYTEGPETFKDYLKQRKRWQKSFIECLFNYRKSIFKNAFAKSLPFFMVIDALFIGIISSFIILIFSTLVVKNILMHNPNHILIYLIIFITTHLIYNISGVFIASHYNVKYKGFDILRLLTTILLDITIYRVVILFTILIGTFSYFTSKHIWNKVDRSGTNYNVLKKSDNYG